MAQRLHLTVSLLALTVYRAKLRSAMRLLLCGASAMLCSLLAGLLCAHSVGMAAAGHPELGLLFGAPAALAIRPWVGRQGLRGRSRP